MFPSTNRTIFHALSANKYAHAEPICNALSEGVAKNPLTTCIACNTSNARNEYRTKTHDEIMGSRSRRARASSSASKKAHSFNTPHQPRVASVLRQGVRLGVEKETAMRMRTLTLSACLAFAITGLAVASPPSKDSLMLGCATAEIYTVTAYCPCSKCCGRWSGGPTASGKMPVAGVTVAGPRSIPFGTRVWIEGVGERVVQDRLARKYDGRFDVYFSSHAEALRFGNRTLKVRILQ